MIQIARYRIGPDYHTQHVINEARRVYEHHGAVVYVDRNPVTHRAEIFAHIGDGMLWFVAAIHAGNAWAHLEERVQRCVDSWIETFMEDR